MAGHPDEAVKETQDVKDVPSRLVAEAKLRHGNARSDWATPQERKQAAVEQAHALSTRPDGSYAQLHETEEPTLAVADEAAVSELQKDQEQARERLRGSEPVNTEAGAKREEEAAKQRDADREATAKQAQAEQKQTEKQAPRK
jgi:hypothetical protein